MNKPTSLNKDFLASPPFPISIFKLKELLCPDKIKTVHFFHGTYTL